MVAATRRRVAAPRRTLRVLLREDLVRGLLPLPAGQARVDRDKGIIAGVKVLSRTSPNRHGLAAATNGTEYTREAVEKACHLYEGAKVNVNHPDRDRPGKDREAEDRLGKLVNVRVVDGELYGDLHCLKSHPMWERVAEAAERMPDAFALSHNAWGKGEVRGGTYYVSEIPEVRSVDLVADGGTNRSLLESGERAVKKTLREALAATRKPDVRKGLVCLLELDDGMGEMPAAEPAAGGEEPELHDHCAEVVRSVLQAVKDGEMDVAEGQKKVIQAYKIACDEKVDESDEEESSGKQTDKKETDAEGDAGKKEEKKTEESRKHARALCKLAGVGEEKELIESLAALPEADRYAHLTWLKTKLTEGRGTAANGAGTPRTSPKSSAPGGAGGGTLTLADLKKGLNRR